MTRAVRSRRSSAAPTVARRCARSSASRRSDTRSRNRLALLALPGCGGLRLEAARRDQLFDARDGPSARALPPRRRRTADSESGQYLPQRLDRAASDRKLARHRIAYTRHVVGLPARCLPRAQTERGKEPARSAPLRQDAPSSASSTQRSRTSRSRLRSIAGPCRSSAYELIAGTPRPRLRPHVQSGERGRQDSQPDVGLIVAHVRLPALARRVKSAASALLRSVGDPIGRRSL